MTKAKPKRQSYKDLSPGEQLKRRDPLEQITVTIAYLAVGGASCLAVLHTLKFMVA